MTVVVVVVVPVCGAEKVIGDDVALVEVGSEINTMLLDDEMMLFAETAFTLISVFVDAADSSAKLKVTKPAS